MRGGSPLYIEAKYYGDKWDIRGVFPTEMKMMKMKATQRGQEAHRGPERPEGHAEAQR